jgi:hypothetical protein
MGKGAKIALLAVTVTAAISSGLFWKQGGFGGGHGDFDSVIFVLGLPWAGISWPELLAKHDFVWLIGLPFTLNVVLVLLIAVVVRRMRHKPQQYERV